MIAMQPGRNLLTPLLLLVLAGCTSAPSSPGPSPYGSSSAAATTPAAWSAEPLSWKKLQRIEGWLSSSAVRRQPEAVPTAELELARGRVEMTRQDLLTTPSGVLQHRLDLAEAGFRRVLGDSHTRSFERTQADRGLAEVDRLRDGAQGTTDLGALGPILPRSSWGAASAAPSRLVANLRPWTRITVHHSATEGTGPDVIRRIQKDHMQRRDFGDIGYHFLIDPKGNVYQGRELRWQGAHSSGRNNVGNIGICLLGDFEKAPADPRALHSLVLLVEALRQRHGIPRNKVLGHMDLKATECPGRYLEDWVHGYRVGNLTQAPRQVRGQRTAAMLR